MALALPPYALGPASEACVNLAGSTQPRHRLGDQMTAVVRIFHRPGETLRCVHLFDLRPNRSSQVVVLSGLVSDLRELGAWWSWDAQRPEGARSSTSARVG